ncbi:MAG TPA: helix-turn-helix domain-containing protein [Solirubrobacteraceae bacterium]|jgi:hypothetical protein|nr:helix-turn-helix domain-containing protein [Solirubrobacteraceae bacterium]
MVITYSSSTLGFATRARLPATPDSTTDLVGDPGDRRRRAAPTTLRDVVLTSTPPWALLPGVPTTWWTNTTQPPLTTKDVGSRLAAKAAELVSADLSVADVLGSRRDRDACLARHLAMTVARRHDLTYPAIAAVFGCHHATVISAVRGVERRALTDEDVARMLDELAGTWHRPITRQRHPTTQARAAAPPARRERVERPSPPPADRPATRRATPEDAAAPGATAPVVDDQSATARAALPPCAVTAPAKPVKRVKPDPASIERQRTDALKRADVARLAKAGAKKAVGELAAQDGCRRVAGALEGRETWAMACRGSELLRAIHKVGPAVARSLCATAAIESHLFLRDVDPERVAALARLVRRRAVNGPQGRSIQAPTSNPAQARGALDDANTTRKTRVALKRRLGSATRLDAFVQLVTVIENPLRHEALNDVTIGQMLLCVHRIGHAAIDRLCGEAGVARTRTFAQIDAMPASRRRRIAKTLLHYATEPLDGKEDATRLIEWLEEIGYKPFGARNEYLVKQARSGRITIAHADELLTGMDRGEMVAILFSDAPTADPTGAFS